MQSLYAVSADKRLRSDRSDKSWWMVLKVAASEEEALARVNVSLRDWEMKERKLLGKDTSAPPEYPYVATGARPLTESELEEITLRLEDDGYRFVVYPASWRPDMERYGEKES